MNCKKKNDTCHYAHSKKKTRNHPKSWHGRRERIKPKLGSFFSGYSLWACMNWLALERKDTHHHNLSQEYSPIYKWIGQFDIRYQPHLKYIPTTSTFLETRWFLETIKGHPLQQGSFVETESYPLEMRWSLTHSWMATTDSLSDTRDGHLNATSHPQTTCKITTTNPSS